MNRRFVVEYVYLDYEYGRHVMPTVKSDKLGEILVNNRKNVESYLLAELRKILLKLEQSQSEDFSLLDWCFYQADELLYGLSEFSPSGSPVYIKIFNFIKKHNVRCFIQYLEDEKQYGCDDGESLVHGFVRETEYGLIIIKELKPSVEELYAEKIIELENRIKILEEKLSKLDIV